MHRSPRRKAGLAARAEDLPAADRDFIAASMEREATARRRARRVQALVYGLLVGVCRLVGWMNEEYLKEYSLHAGAGAPPCARRGG